MASLDTNVLARYLVRDDESQFEQARQLAQQQVHGRQPLHIPTTCESPTALLCETATKRLCCPRCREMPPFWA